jgi:RND family efflux transporter MFP subunit
MSTTIQPANPPLAPTPARSSHRPASSNKALPPKKHRLFGRSIWLGLGGVLALAAIGLGVRLFFWSEDTTAVEITAVVKRSNLPIIVTEKGDIESAKTVDARSEVEGSVKIVSIVAEGTNVKKGDTVVTFDMDQLNRDYLNQEIKLRQAEGKAKSSLGELEVAKNKAETDIAKAELDLTLANLDKRKYLEGEYKVEVNEKQGLLSLAKKELQESEEKLESYRKLGKRGFMSIEQVKVKEAELSSKRYAVDRDEAKLMVLQRFTKERQEAELTAKAIEANRALVRTKSSSQASVDKAQSELEAAQVTAKLEKATLDRMKRQLDNCVVKAPQDGILVYSKDRYWDPASKIQPGAMIHYQQTLFSLPDLSRMQVNAKVHEAMVKKIKVGQKAEIKVDAIPNIRFEGVVEKVATLADSRSPWSESSVKEYVTIIKIVNLPPDAGLKPGMTAETTVKIQTIPNVLIVPVQAVSEHKGKHFAYVSRGRTVEKREVMLGESNDKYVVVASGLEEDEHVVLDARARLAEETKKEEAVAGDEKTPPAATPTAPATPAATSSPSASPGG